MFAQSIIQSITNQSVATVSVTNQSHRGGRGKKQFQGLGLAIAQWYRMGAVRTPPPPSLEPSLRKKRKKEECKLDTKKNENDKLLRQIWLDTQSPPPATTAGLR